MRTSSKTRLPPGREQQVDYVLASNYQIADGKIRVTAQLFNVASGQIEETYKSEKDAATFLRCRTRLQAKSETLLLARFAINGKQSAGKARDDE